MGAWIETTKLPRMKLQGLVAPYVGAWIETDTKAIYDLNGNVSHPTWVRGLKPNGH